MASLRPLEDRRDERPFGRISKRSAPRREHIYWSGDENYGATARRWSGVNEACHRIVEPRATADTTWPAASRPAVAERVMEHANENSATRPIAERIVARSTRARLHPANMLRAAMRIRQVRGRLGHDPRGLVPTHGLDSIGEIVRYWRPDPKLKPVMEKIRAAKRRSRDLKPAAKRRRRRVKGLEAARGAQVRITPPTARPGLAGGSGAKHDAQRNPTSTSSAAEGKGPTLAVWPSFAHRKRSTEEALSLQTLATKIPRRARHQLS